MIQDIEPHHLFNEFTPKVPADEDLVFVFSGPKLLADIQEDSCHFPHIRELQTADLNENLIWLFRLDETSCFLLELSQETAEAFCQENSGFSMHSLKEFRGCLPKDEVFAAMTAFHLYDWYRNNRFCGRCGHPTVPDTKQRMLFCPECKNMIFPKIAPAIIVGVIDGDRLLLTKYAGPGHKSYALVAGFTEIGETAEQTVMREVMEETGLKVKNIHYYKTQPWGIASDLLIGYFAELDGDASITLDQNELAMGEWVSQKDLDLPDDDFSMTSQMIAQFALHGRNVLEP